MKISPAPRFRIGAAAIAAFIAVLISGELLSAGAPVPVVAVVPARGELTGAELRSIVKEIRIQLRIQGYALAIQKTVRDAMVRQGITGMPSQTQLDGLAKMLGADSVLVPVVTGKGTEGYELIVLRQRGDNGDAAVRGVRASFPSRGAAVYTQKQIKPAAAATVAFLFDSHPNPVDGPFPSLRKVDAGRILSNDEDIKPSSGETASKESAVEDEAPEEDSKSSEVSDKGTDKKEKRDWERWDHKGLFGEIGFMFSWCRQEGLCATTSKGYGARFRAGIRIMSYVALSVSGIAVDHQMPITTNTEVFLNVDSAFVFAGFFGGLRVHPVRRFIVDPFVGIDFGNMWLLYSENTTVEPDTNIPASIAVQLEGLNDTRREVIYLRGFTVTPEIGFNVFIAPSFAFGFHVQWLIPFWKKACVQVYNPTLEGLKNTKETCDTLKNIKSNETMDEQVVEKLSKKDNLPRFVSIELDLTLLFK